MKISPSSPTVAAKLTSASGPAARIASLRPFSTRKSSKASAKTPARATTMTTNVEASPTPAPSASVGKKATWAWTVATFFGAGLLKPGPGTWGSLAAAVLWYFGLHAAHLTGWPVVALSLAGVVLVTLIGIPAATIVE